MIRLDGGARAIGCAVNFEDRPQSGPLPFNAAIRKEQLAVAA